MPGLARLVALALLHTASIASEPADTLDARVEAHQQAGRFAEAESAARESLEIRRAESDDTATAKSLYNLGLALRNQNKLADARAFYDESLALRRQARGDVHVDVAEVLNSLGILSLVEGDLAAARAHFEEVLAISRAVLVEDDQRIAAALNSLGKVAKDEGDYETARELWRESLQILTDAAPDHPNVGIALNNLGSLAMTQGDYRASRLYLDQALAFQERLSGPSHPDVGRSLNNLAALLKALGDFDAALPLFERSLEIQRQTRGPRHPKVATTMSNMAGLFSRTGDDARAVTLYEEAGAILREALGPRHPAVARNMANRATLLGDEQAIPILQEVVAIIREALGERHPVVATHLHNLATAQLRQGNAEAAHRGLELSLEIRKETLGARHRAVATTLTALANLHEGAGDVATTRRLRAEAVGIVIGHLDFLDGLSEREAFRFLPSVRTTLYKWLVTFDRPEDAADGWRHVMDLKGAVAARARAARAVAGVEPEAAEIAAELRGVRRQLARAAFAESSPERDESQRALAAEQERLERDLLTRSAKFRSTSAALPATPDALCAALPENAALIDMFRYRTYGPPRYLAFVQRSGDCSVHRVDLGNAVELDAAAAAWSAVVGDPAGQANRVRSRGLVVSEQLLRPLEAIAGDSEHWLVVPDGAMAALPLGASRPTMGSSSRIASSPTWIGPPTC